jgi:hypothetical protein
MHQLMLATALSVVLSLSLGAEAASAKAADPSPQRAACRMASAAAPLKLLRPGVLVENRVNAPAGRVSRRATYTPVPNVADAREQALVLLERQSKPTNLMVGVGF